ncbi:hypothetical protein KFE25_009095 [Diacronema lutheri]|uniref:Uncharacterized protein n=2 Tax=Diacronema lutheri TaxID=2081491 RepID=A0A8J5Y495_DIALT|nr:hypothetical protein KFE25_009095 [Diacronema lutheri]
MNEVIPLPSLEECQGVDFRNVVATIAQPICQGLEREDPAVAPLLGELFRTSDGVRGFFVNYLTDPSLTKPDSASPPAALLNALNGAENKGMISELMVMNVVMPSATSMAHLRNGDEDAAVGSRLTARRASALLSSATIEPARADMLAVLAVCEGQGPCSTVTEERLNFWGTFCNRWQYDEQQRQMIAMVMRALTEQGV